MHKASIRIQGITLEEATDEQRALMGEWHKMNFTNVFARSPELFKAFIPLIAKVVATSSLPSRDRQVLCLRTLTLGHDVYEVTHHELISKSVGLNDSEIAAMRAGTGKDLTPFDKTLIKAAEQLVRDQYINDETWQALSERYSQTQLMEVVVLAGAYITMAMVTRNYGIPLEDTETFNGFAKMRKSVYK